MKHLSELLERLNEAKSTYTSADGSLDCSPLQVILAKEALNRVRFEWYEACSEFVIDNILVKEEENV